MILGSLVEVEPKGGGWGVLEEYGKGGRFRRYEGGRDEYFGR